MKKVAKVLSMVLAAGCVASMAACGGSDLAFGKEMLSQKSQMHPYLFLLVFQM